MEETTETQTEEIAIAAEVKAENTGAENGNDQTAADSGSVSEVEEAAQEHNDEPPVEKIAREIGELVALCEALIFVSDEPLTLKVLCEVLDEDKESVTAAVEQLQNEYEERESGLQIREVAGGWQLSTRTELHETIRIFLKTKPSAKLSLASLETLAVIAYKQPVTVPEILDIRGVQSASAIKTLLEKRLIITKGHKETVGRPMQYGTSKEFLIQFGLKDLSELPSIEDFEDLVQ